MAVLDEPRKYSTHISSRNRTELNYKNPEDEVDYPSRWFELHVDAKPQVTLPACRAEDRDFWNAVRGGIQSVGLTITTAKIALYRYGRGLTSVAEERWVSFNREIAAAGTEITPWDIVSVMLDGEHTTTENAPRARENVNAPAPEADKWTNRAMVMYILCIYRLVKITNNEYREALQNKMSDQLRSEGGIEMSFHGAAGVYGSWINDKAFLKMVAAYDMYLFRFKLHPDAVLRMGSLGSRYRDCAGLLSIGFMMSFLNIPAGELMDWIFIRTMGEEMRQMAKEGQESGDRYSYFPYQSDMGLVLKSAYSSNSNSYLFHWVHMLGSILGHRRSINARYNFEGNVADVGLNAVILAWVYSKGGDLGPQFAVDGIDYAANIGVGAPDNELDVALTDQDNMWIAAEGREPRTWFGLLKAGGFKVPPVVARAIRRQREKIPEAREETVGEYVRTKLIF